MRRRLQRAINLRWKRPLFPLTETLALPIVDIGQHGVPLKLTHLYRAAKEIIIDGIVDQAHGCVCREEKILPWAWEKTRCMQKVRVGPPGDLAAEREILSQSWVVA
tara:strand:+ start:42 stop:359 length:318 start_codon:yes stop_codon:yes gene_type:complete